MVSSQGWGYIESYVIGVKEKELLMTMFLVFRLMPTTRTKVSAVSALE